MTKLLVLDGPGPNLPGIRAPAVHGKDTLADVAKPCRGEGAKPGGAIACHRYNHEGQLIDRIHEAGREFAAGGPLGVVRISEGRN